MSASAAHDIFVCAEEQVLPETDWLVKELGKRAHSVSMDRSSQLQKGQGFILYLHGGESLPELRSFFRTIVTIDYDWLLLYVAHHSLEAAAKIGFVAGQELPKPAEFAFDAQRLRECVMRVCNLWAHPLPDVKRSFSAGEVLRARKTLELTQEQLARALQVTTRTIQNWERNIATSQLDCKARDLRELLELLGEYVLPGKEADWLRTKHEAFAGQQPLDLLIAGKLRDLIVEFRRLQEGQPV